MKELTLEQMEQIEGGDCVEVLMGFVVMSLGLYFAPLAHVGLGMALGNSRSCAQQLI